MRPVWVFNTTKTGFFMMWLISHFVILLSCLSFDFKDVSRTFTFSSEDLNQAEYEPPWKPTKWLCPVWSESSLCAQRVGKDTSFLHGDSKDSDQTGRMRRLIWDFAGRTCCFVGFVMRLLISFCYWLLSWLHEGLHLYTSKTTFNKIFTELWPIASLDAQTGNTVKFIKFRTPENLLWSP